MRAGSKIRQVDEQSRSLEQELERLRRVRQRFFWSLSHELRTPLNVILCYNDLMSSGVFGPLNERQELAAERMAASITQLKELVEGVFELSEIENRRVPVSAESIDVCSLAREVASELEPIADANGLYLRVECGSSRVRVGEGKGPGGEIEAISDPAKVRRVLVSLCSNALRLTAEGGVTIRVHSDSSWVRIDVVDTSDGFDEVELEQIFEEFAQFGSTRRHAGLNLTLAHRLALLLGAEIEVSSSKGRGSVFSLRLPARRRVVAGG